MSPLHAARWIAIAVVCLGHGTGADAGAGDGLPLNQIAPGVYVRVGPHGELSPDNLGAVSNVAVVVGGRSVAVVDTGGSRLFGEKLLAAVRGITDKPISHVINTHVHPDHMLGNVAFKAPGVRFVGHRKLPRAVAQRGPYYIDNLTRLVGPAFQGTELVAPDLLVETRLDIDLGERRLTLVAHPTAHTDNDLSVFDHASGTLFTGDLLFMERLPVVDGSIKGWVKLMQALAARDSLDGTRIERVVPGHGPASAPWPAAAADQDRYLKALLTGTRQAVARDEGIENAIRSVAPEEASRWQLFEDNHPRNVTSSYTELEWE